MVQQSQAKQIQPYSNVQPVWKFCFLYIITFGIYQIPWGHKHWKFIKEREGLKINAWFRSWILPFTLYWLAKRMFSLAEEKGYKEKPSPSMVAGLFWFFFVLSWLPEPLWLISFLSFLPLLTVLKAANFYWEKEQPNFPLRKSLTGREIAWTIFGVIFWFLVLLGSFMSSEG
jgi:hypothetical protein